MELNAAGAMLDDTPTVAPKPASKDVPGKAAVGAKQLSKYKEALGATARSFMENGGQWDKNALFLAQSSNLNLWVTASGLRSEYYMLSNVKGSSFKKGQVVDMSFVGGKATGYRGVNKLPTVTQFLHGRDNTKTAFSYDSVMLDSVYQNVDLKLYNDAKRPRYDIVLRPGAEASTVKMQFKGADYVKIGKKGDLELGTALGALEHRGLFAYQVKNGKKVQVPAQFVQLTKDTIGFKLGSYDKSAAVIVDPIVYGTYYGGDTGIDEVRAVTADADAGIYFTGSTQAPDFPVLFGPFSFNITGTGDAFIAKLRGDAYVHEYSAYIGGSGQETGKYIALDPAGSTIWIAGMTSSANFPGISGSSLQGARSGALDMFLISFVKSPVTVLAPSYSTYFGSAGTEELGGFAISPVTGNLVLYGQMGAGLPSSSNAYPGAANANAFVTSLTPNGQSVVFSQYHGGTANQHAGVAASFFGAAGPQGLVANMNQGLTGIASNLTSRLTSNALAVDANDNILITGTVIFNSNQDTSVGGAVAYPTTPGVFANGRIIRFTDVFVAKFNSLGTVVYSAVLGGANTDFGSAIAVDESGNAYLTGISGSHDFPRTTGTYGQTFTNAANVFVTKLNVDASQIVYSTNLRTTNSVTPTGIAVNQRGFAFITGIVDAGYQFPNPLPDPIEPSSNVGIGAIQTNGTLGAPIRGTYGFPATPELPTTDGFLNIIDSEAENLLYGTYVGGLLDDICFAPFVDRVGDVWVMGYTNSQRDYYPPVIMATPPKRHQPPNGTAGLDAGFITSLAFKSAVQPGGVIDFPPNTIFATPDYFTGGPPLINVAKFQDGYLFRFRLDIPLVTNLVLAPSTIAGGLGQSSTGTVTISGPAPAEGVDVVVSLDNTAAASFDASSSVSQITVTIAPGNTTGTFTVFSSPVIDPSQVNVKAEYLGSFKISLLTVNPWLSQLTLTPTTVISGNTSTGRVTLFAVATEDVVVSLTTDNPTLISFPAGNTVTVPTGQQSVNFPIQTTTVDTQQQGNISASFLGKTRTQVLIVKPASLSSLVFNPNRVAGGGASTGTVTLDGNAPSTGAIVTLSKTTNPANITTLPASVTVLPGERTATFQAVTNFVASNTFSVVRATYNLVNKDATLLIDNISLTSFTLNPSSIQGGGSVSATVVLNQPAPPGGAFVTITGGDANVVPPDEDPSTVGNQVLVAANNTSRTFNIGTKVVIVTDPTTVSASRGGAPIVKPLTITPVDFTITITPSSVLGGIGTATMKITLTGAAPVGGVPISISKTSLGSNPPDATGNVIINGGNPVVITVGNTTQNFTITTTAVTATDTVRVTGQIATNIHSADLTVRAPKVTGITFSPSTVRGLLTTTVTVTLDGPAPPAGATISLSAAPNSQIVNLPATINIPGGDASASVLVTTNKVSRSLASQVTATYGGGTSTATLTVTR